MPIASPTVGSLFILTWPVISCLVLWAVDLAVYLSYGCALSGTVLELSHHLGLTSPATKQGEKHSIIVKMNCASLLIHALGISF